MTLNQKISVIKKINQAGICDEKKLQTAEMECLLVVPGITISDLKTASEIKRAVKENKLFSYLSEEVQNG